jgi:Ca-activated chloride channel homolog
MKSDNIRFMRRLISLPPFFSRRAGSGRRYEIIITIMIICLISFDTFSVHGQAERKYIRQGNSKFSGGKYPESEIAYRKAIDKNKMSQDAVFNLGDALYKQKKYEDAGKVFLENAGGTLDKQKKANSYFNLGNSLLNNKKLEESIDSYKNSLRLDPGSREAKYNLAYAQDMLKHQQEQQKQNQNKDNKDQQKKDQNKDQKKDQNKDNKDQNKDQQQQQQKQNQQTMSKEDAQRLLDALANDEQKVQEKVRLEKAAKMRVKTLINW